MELEYNLEALPFGDTCCMVGTLDSFVLHLMRPGAVGYLCTADGVAQRIAVRGAELAQCLAGTEEQAINGVLLLLGIPPHYVGYPYAAEAVIALRRDGTQSITKGLYYTLAKRHCTDARQIERAIRSAITSGWARGDNMVWAMLFPSEPGGSVLRPTNGQFLFRLARLFDIWDIPYGDTNSK